jgi:valyl-tRNA synthetase
VRAIRTLRSEASIAPDKKLRVTVKVDSARTNLMANNAPLVCLLSGLNSLEVADANNGDSALREGAIVLSGGGFQAFVYMAGAVDISLLKAKWTRDSEKDKKFIAGLQAKLANENFVKNAPAELVEAEKAKLASALERNEKIESYLQTISN